MKVGTAVEGGGIANFGSLTSEDSAISNDTDAAISGGANTCRPAGEAPHCVG